MRGIFSSFARFRYLLLVMVLGGGITAGLFSLPAGADLTKPQANDRQVTRVVSSLMRREHLTKHPLDDEISRRAMKSFLKSLDPMKVYFMQEDIDEFAKRDDEIDDMVQQGDIRLAYDIFNRFLKRVDERVELVDDLLKKDHDFTIDEEIVTDPDLTRYPRDAAEVRNRWRKRIKYDLLFLKVDKKEGDEAREQLQRRYRSFAKRMHQTDSDELLEMFLTSVTTSFDPHTTYMSPSSLDNFRILMRLNLDGIGAALQVKDGYTVVTKVIPKGAADKHGKLKVEDRIVSVGQGDEGEMVDVVDMKLGDVVKMIRGRAGTIVRLGVLPEGGQETQVYKITRARIELTDSEARGEVIDDVDSVKKPDGKNFRIGYIDLPSFYMDMEGARLGKPDYKSTTRDVRQILRDFKEKGVDVVVLDLSKNGGGSLTEAINLTGLFIDQGPVVQVKDPGGRVHKYKDLDPGMEWEGPLVVMTTKFSASASEILAGAIQDYGRGIVVGDQSTHGKGTVQSLLDLGNQLFPVPNPPNLGALKITMQQFYRPNGDSTQKRGVLADVVLPSITDHMDVAESDLDHAVDFDKVDPAPHEKTNMIDGGTLQKIRAQSADRRRASEDFAKLLRNIDRYREQKARKSTTLNEKEFFARREALNAEQEEKKTFDQQVNPDHTKINRDFYFNEVMAIALDYASELQKNKVAKK